MTATTAALTPRLEIHREAPAYYRAMLALGHTESDLEPSLRELVKVRASQLNGCAYCLDMHTKDARAAGEAEQRLYALNAWRETPFFTPRERAALALAEAITLVADGQVPDDVYAEAERHFPPAELAQLIWQVVIINAWNRVAITTRMVPGSYQPAGAH
jgi:AhpD family alkylhydroperoxidase